MFLTKFFRRFHVPRLSPTTSQHRTKSNVSSGGKLERQKTAPVDSPEFCKQFRKIQYMDLRCKNVFITGAAGSVGLATARALLNEGAGHVVIADISDCAGLNAVAELNSKEVHDTVSYVSCDVRDGKSYRKAFCTALENCHGCIDVLINNAGLINERRCTWEESIQVNLKGCIRGTLLAMEHMKQNKNGGCIMNISSMAAIKPYVKMPVYSATKNAVLGFTSSLGTEETFKKTQIRFVTLCPGITESNNLSNLNKKLLNPDWAKDILKELKKSKETQSVGKVADGAVHTLKYGVNGGVYVIDNGRLFRYVPPDYKEHSQQEAVYF